MRLLDTDAVIDLLRRRDYEDGSISAITLIEVLRGIAEEKRAGVKELLEESFDVIGLDNETILAYCTLYQALKKKGESIPDADLLIGATAISRDIPLTTGDHHFQRLKEFGLRITD